MGYQLIRNEGALVSTKDVTLPRTDVAIRVELRKHELDSGQVSVAWYNNGTEWKIFVAGETAERFMKQ